MNISLFWTIIFIPLLLLLIICTNKINKLFTNRTIIPHSSQYTFRIKLNEVMLEITDIVNQMDIIDIYKLFHPKPKQWISSQDLMEFVTKTDHILRLKASLNRCKKIKITSCILSDCNRIKLSIIGNRNDRKLTKS